MAPTSRAIRRWRYSKVAEEHELIGIAFACEVADPRVGERTDPNVTLSVKDNKLV
jgi:hypothetical protein